jgi:CRISPR-associated protein Cmr4
VWITCPDILREFDVTETDPGEQVRLPRTLGNYNHLNLGWLMLGKAPGDSFRWPKTIKGVPNEVKDRAVLISDKLFGQVVNSNLEVRTSVSIDPETGAAAEHALFTYEAIPRASFLWLDVVEDDFCKDPKKPEKFPSWPIKQTKLGKAFPNGEEWQRPLHVVRAGLKLAEHLGIGGMGTRGFGRVRLLN